MVEELLIRHCFFDIFTDTHITYKLYLIRIMQFCKTWFINLGIFYKIVFINTER